MKKCEGSDIRVYEWFGKTQKGRATPPTNPLITIRFEWICTNKGQLPQHFRLEDCFLSKTVLIFHGIVNELPFVEELQANVCNFTKKNNSMQVLSCQFWEICQDSLLSEHRLILLLSMTSLWYLNPITTIVALHIETNQLMWNADQLTCFYMMGNIDC